MHTERKLYPTAALARSIGAFILIIECCPSFLPSLHLCISPLLRTWGMPRTGSGRPPKTVCIHEGLLQAYGIGAGSRDHGHVSCVPKRPSCRHTVPIADAGQHARNSLARLSEPSADAAPGISLADSLVSLDPEDLQ